MSDKRLTRVEKIAIVITLALTVLAVGYRLGVNAGERANAGMSVSYLDTATAQQSEKTEDTAEQTPASSTESVQWPININEASSLELQLLPGIGEVRARNIVLYRETNGSFKAIEDITRVEGIGSGILEDILDLITIGGARDENTGS